SYVLMWMMDASIACYSSTVLESASRGVPTAALANAFFKEAAHILINSDSNECVASVVSQLFQRQGRVTREELCRVFRFVFFYRQRLPKRFRAIGIRQHYDYDFHF
ncbi:MAG: hypothetical protein ACOYOF_10500, partial [Verrucomicrobiaceae bacterium]